MIKTKKKILSLALAILAVFSSTALTAETKAVAYDENQNVDYQKGDINGDNLITASDYLFVKNLFLSGEILSMKKSIFADIDNNGKIESADYLMMKSHFLGNITISKDGFYNEKDITGYNGNVDDDTLLKIKEDYATLNNTYYNYPPSDVDVRALSGSFNGAYVMMINFKNFGSADCIVEKTIGGVDFMFTSSQELSVWKDGSFYSLEKAYEENILTSEDLGIANGVYRMYYAANIFG